MSVAAADVLRPAPWSKSLTRWWRGADLPAVVSLVASKAGLRGQLLPYTRVDGRPAFPLAVIDDDLAAQRLQRDQWPILDRGVLKDHASTGFVEAPPEAVALAGFVVVEPFRVARQHLAGLRTWAPTVAAVPTWRPLDALAAAECDYYGYRVVITDGVDASPLAVEVRPRRQPSRHDPWRRLRDEQMFQLALECGLVTERTLTPLHERRSVRRLL